MRKTTPEELGAWLVLFFVFFLPGGAITSPFSPPPFKTDLPAAVLVVEDVDARDEYKADQLDAMLGADGPTSIRGNIKPGGLYVLWNKTQQPSKDSPPWVAEALTKVQGMPLPAIVGATPTSGFPGRTMPEKNDEIISLIKGLK